MKRRLSISVSILAVGALLCLACNDLPTASSPDLGTSDQIASKKPGNPGNKDEVPLMVTIDDSQAGLTSDGEGDYVHGVDQVRAVLRANGNLNFDPAELGKREVFDPDVHRSVNVRIEGIAFADGQFTIWEFNDVDAGLNTNAQASQYADIPPPPGDEDVVLRDMEDGASGRVTTGLGWRIGDTKYTVRFGRTCDARVFDYDKRAIATRLDDTWTLEGDAAYFCMEEITNRPSGYVAETVSEDASASFKVMLSVDD